MAVSPPVATAQFWFSDAWPDLVGWGRTALHAQRCLSTTQAGAPQRAVDLAAEVVTPAVPRSLTDVKG